MRRSSSRLRHSIRFLRERERRDGHGADESRSFEEAADRVQAHHDAAKAVNEDVPVICHGGPIAWPDDAECVLNNIESVVGFFGASSIERRPTEEAIQDQAEN